MAGAVAAVIGVGVALLIAVGEQRDDSLARLRREGVVRIGYAMEAPYAFATSSGQVTGEAPEIAMRMVAALGLGAVQWRQYEFGRLIDSLNAGEIDVIAAGMFVTPERTEEVAFSRPTCRVGQGLLVAKGNPRRLRSYEQLAADRDLRVAVLSGSVEERMLRRLGMAAEQVVRVPDAAAGLAGLESGMVDALALSAPTVRWLATHAAAGRCEAAEPFQQPPERVRDGVGLPAFAFRLRDRQLRAAWDERLGAWLGGAEHRALAERFGFSAAEIDEGLAERSKTR